jgi:glycosyltransferase involved in cell wall biosynthesis
VRIAYVAAGAGGMYCGSCLHDNALARGLMALGHDVALVPVYTPIRTEDEDVSAGRVFYGAIGVFLEQKAAWLQRAPAFVHRLLALPSLLNLASRLGASVDPHDLGALTLSVLQGEDGRQGRELRELVGWLRRSYRPDVVHLTNSMLLGMAGPIRRDLGVPVVCSLQGEDLFLDGLEEPYRTRAREILRGKARDADRFLAPCAYYARAMGDLLDLPPDRVRVVPLGVRTDDHRRGERPGGEPFTVGYLARICPEKGLHVLAEAFRILAGQAGPDRVRLRAAGYLGPRDRRYLEEVRGRLRDWGLAGSFDYLGEVDRRGKIAFLEGIDVLSVPTTYRESKGLFVLESLASAVPVVQPRHGSFPELIEATGGGLLVEPGSPEALAAGLRSLMDDAGRRRALGLRGRDAVRARFSERAMAEATAGVFAAALRPAA